MKYTDIKLYIPDSQFALDNIPMGLNTSAIEGATIHETIANKVVKFLMTEKGTDIFDPLYGSVVYQYIPVASGFIPILRNELRNDLGTCFKFIKTNEDSTASVKLKKLTLVDVQTNRRANPKAVTIKVNIVTTDDVDALLDLSVVNN